jgi:4-diphosphocytidyl-2C-methyl-D-erythritol kinase
MVPSQPVPTAAFYERYRAEHPLINDVPDDVGRAFAKSGAEDLRDLIENDFERTASDMVPEIGDGLRIARQFFPQGTALTGSGSVFFSLVPEGEEGVAAELSARLGERGIASYLCFLIFS